MRDGDCMVRYHTYTLPPCYGRSYHHPQISDSDGRIAIGCDDLLTMICGIIYATIRLVTFALSMSCAGNEWRLIGRSLRLSMVWPLCLQVWAFMRLAKSNILTMNERIHWPPDCTHVFKHSILPTQTSFPGGTHSLHFTFNSDGLGSCRCLSGTV